jgi:hypothetical protein
VIVLALLLAAVLSAPPRVLFIGNSLTAANDLPLVVEALSVADGQPLEVDALTASGFSLFDHWNSDARRAIAGGGRTWVILQQGPSALPESRRDLRAAAATYAPAIRQAGASVAFYMVWPSRARFGDFDRVSESYRLAAADVSGRLLPAGDAWRAAWRRRSDLALYDTDAFHPSPSGSYLAALVVYAGLTGRSPVGLPSELRLGNGRVVKIPADEAHTLQLAAADVVMPAALPR